MLTLRPNAFQVGLVFFTCFLEMEGYRKLNISQFSHGNRAKFVQS
jgi:hypothetical protein